MEFRTGSIVVVGVLAVSWMVPARGPLVHVKTTGHESAGDVAPAAVADAGGAGAAAPALPTAPEELQVRYRADARGHSGALLVLQALPGERVQLPIEWLEPRPAGVTYRWIEVLDARGVEIAEKGAPMPLGPDDTAVVPRKPGIYRPELAAGTRSRRLDQLDLIVKVPFSEKKNGRINGYRIGRYATEGQNRTDRYAPPDGFIEVTTGNRDLRLSEHFTLGEFLTKNQHDVWPKYVVLDLRLLDKLELVMQDLNARGIRADRMEVMSGYRTPEYNNQGVGRGRASLSRHTYGDAADVWVDNDDDGYMDDLNGDGRRDTRDARVMLESVERVEQKYPDLVGGAGIYRDNGAHGPFIHIDARGRRARW